MKKQRKAVLPIAGKIQHGEKNGNSVKELKYFIAKAQNDRMQFLADRFNKTYPKQNSIKIRIFDEEPLYIRYARYNTSGTVCFCKEDEDIARQKVQNKWQEVECLETCEHRQKNKNGKTACNREGLLKFMLPDICQDMIWIIQIKGQQSINNLDDYFSFQKQLGNSIVGDYNLFLFEKEQPTASGIYKNQVLNIVKAENSQNKVINSSVSTNNTQNVEKDKQKTNKKLISDKKKTETKPVKQDDMGQSKTTNKQKSKIQESTQNKVAEQKPKEDSKPKQVVEQNQIEVIDESKVTEDDLKKLYYFISSNFKKCNSKDGIKEYLFITFADSEDKQIEVVIPPIYTEELSSCDIGTVMLLELSKKGEFTFPTSMKFLNKCIKKAVA